METRFKEWIEEYNKNHEDHHGKIWIVNKVEDGIHSAAPIIDITDNLYLAYNVGMKNNAEDIIDLLKKLNLWREPSSNKDELTAEVKRRSDVK